MREIPLALAGRMAAGERVIDLPLIADWPNRPCQRVDHAIGKPTRPRLLLHATALGFIHPSTATMLRVESPAQF